LRRPAVVYINQNRLGWTAGGVKLTESELKVIEKRLIAVELALEKLLARGTELENQAKLEEWY
jgi:hypothetical protein